MKAVTRQAIAGSGWKRWALRCALIAAGMGILWLLPSDVWAELDTGRIETIFKELTAAAKKVAWGVLGIGAIVIGIKFNNGDPDTKQRAWQFLFAGVLIYMAADIVTWLQT